MSLRQMKKCKNGLNAENNILKGISRAEKVIILIRTFSTSADQHLPLPRSVSPLFTKVTHPRLTQPNLQSATWQISQV